MTASSAVFSSYTKPFFVRHLETVSNKTAEDLYKSPAICFTLFRKLRKTTQLILLRMVMNKAFLPVCSIVRSLGMNQTNVVKEDLMALKLLRETISKDIPIYAVPRYFCANLLDAMFQRKPIWFKDAHGGREVDMNKTEKENAKWDNLLKALITGEPEPSDKEAFAMFDKSGYVTTEANGEKSLAGRGFGFLLDSTHEQMWTMLVNVANDEREELRSRAFVFIIELMYTNSTKPISLGLLNDMELSVVKRLFHLGFVQLSENEFIPIMNFLMIDSRTQPSNQLEANNEGFIVLQSNFNMYLFTRSDLHVKIASFFGILNTRLPDLAIFRITRKSVKKAFAMDISAEMIIKYIVTNSRSFETSVNCSGDDGYRASTPENVFGQIKIWENEQNRLIAKDAFMYLKFENEQAFKVVTEYAFSIGALLYCNVRDQIMVVSEEHHNQVKRYWLEKKSEYIGLQK